MQTKQFIILFLILSISKFTFSSYHTIIQSHNSYSTDFIHATRISELELQLTNLRQYVVSTFIQEERELASLKASILGLTHATEIHTQNIQILFSTIIQINQRLLDTENHLRAMHESRHQLDTNYKTMHDLQLDLYTRLSYLERSLPKKNSDTDSNS